MKFWMIVAMMAASGCSAATDDRESEFDTAALDVSGQTEVNLGDYEARASTAVGDEIFVSSRVAVERYATPGAAHLHRISDGEVQTEPVGEFLMDLASTDDGHVIGCSTGSKPKLATYDGTYRSELVAELSDPCTESSDDYLPCWGGRVHSCAVTGTSEPTIAMIERWGFDDSPKSTLWRWRDGRFEAMGEEELQTSSGMSLVGIHSDGDPVVWGDFWIEEEEGWRSQVRKGLAVLANRGETKKGHVTAVDELDVIAWHDGQGTATVATYSGSDIGVPLFTMSFDDLDELRVATQGTRVALVSRSGRQLRMSMGAEVAELELEENDELSSIAVSGTALHLLVNSRAEEDEPPTSRMISIPF